MSVMEDRPLPPLRPLDYAGVERQEHALWKQAARTLGIIGCLFYGMDAIMARFGWDRVLRWALHLDMLSALNAIDDNLRALVAGAGLLFSILCILRWRFTRAALIGVAIGGLAQALLAFIYNLLTLRSYAAFQDRGFIAADVLFGVASLSRAALLPVVILILFSRPTMKRALQK